MSGHSKWSNIKHKKGKADAEKAKIFTKIGREIALAVKEGGPDIDLNSRLKDVVTKAKSNNMPNDNIMRSIKKASGELGNVDYEEITYEGYAPGGVAVILDAITDNRNRTAGDVRSYFSKCNGSLGTTGSVSYMFDRKGIILVDKTNVEDEDTLMMLALDAGAEDVQSDDDYYEISTTFNDLSKVQHSLEENGIKIESADVEMIPQTNVDVSDEEQIKNITKLIDLLEDCDDVQKVWHNGNLPDTDDEED